jgi:hypothetical protein
MIRCAILLLVLLALPARAETLILVSIDGFRWDYLDIHEAPALNAIATRGVRVTKMQPVYPSKTFPGHLTLATGLPPAQHGIVDNNFCDSDRGECYRLGDGRKDSTWIHGTPIWNLVELHGYKAATYFWPESDARIGGQVPTYHYHYAKPAPYAARVEQVLDWLALPEPARPRLITLYFSSVDSMGHRHGPNSKEVAEAIAEVDGLIGDLWARAQATLDDVNLLVVSDHGMAEVRSEAAIDVSALPETFGFKHMNGGTRVAYYRDEDDADVDELRSALEAAANGRYQVLDQEILSARGVEMSATTPDLIIETAPPAIFRNQLDGEGWVGGTHGYPATEVDDMAAFLIGAGPAFKTGVVIPEIQQIDVYPVAARVLGISPLQPLPSDGGALNQALVDAPKGP